MKFKSIRNATLVLTLPTILLGIIILSIISYYSSKVLINKQVDNTMHLQLSSNINKIETNLQKHGEIPATLARTVESSLNTMTKENFMSLVQKAPTTNSDTFGTGIWFEPYKYNSDLKYFAPYAYRDKDKIVYTDDYFKAENDYFSNDWYKIGMNTNKPVVWSPPYIDTVTNIPMVTATSPIYDEKHQFLGVTTGDIDLTSLQKMVSEIKVGEKGSAVLLTEDGLYIAGASDPNNNMNVNIAQNPNSGIGALGKEIIAKKKGDGSFTDSNGKNVVYYENEAETGWILALVISEKELYAPLNALVQKLIIISIIIIAIMILTIVLYSNYIANRLKNVNNFSKQIAEGNLTHKLELVSNDEISHMSVNLNYMADNLKNIVTDVSSAIENVVATCEELTASSEQTKIAADEIVNSIQHVANLEEKNNEVTQEVTKTSSEVFSKMKNINNTVEETSKTSTEAYKRAKNGTKVIDEAIEHMNNINGKVSKTSSSINELSKKSNKIENIVSMITQISEQTNLLALNAAIEAARAGEQGKGFAVVADEVRKLAEQSGDSSKQISELISDIQKDMQDAIKSMEEGTGAVEKGLIIVEQAGNSFESILSDVSTMAKQMDKTAIEVKEVYDGTHKVLDSMNGIINIIKVTTENTHNIASATEEQSALMAEVANSSESLTKMATELEVTFTKFKI